MKTTLTSLLMLAASPVLLADISTGAATTTPQSPSRVQGNCDLLASNTVRATFLGLREVQTQSYDQAAPVVSQVAVFQVIDNLAYRRLVRYGDGQLQPGATFSVAMSRDLPGQPATIADTIAQMQPGEEAVLKIDHLYLFGDMESKPIRPCSRMARRGAVPAAQAPQQPQAQVPSVQTTARSRHVSVSVNSNGVAETCEVITEKLPGSDEVKTRMFINGVEVDPQTRQPLTATPTPQQAPQQKADEHGDDTTVEQAPQNAAPTAPAQNSAPASAGESF